LIHFYKSCKSKYFALKVKVVNKNIIFVEEIWLKPGWMK